MRRFSNLKSLFRNPGFKNHDFSSAANRSPSAAQVFTRPNSQFVSNASNIWQQNASRGSLGFLGFQYLTKQALGRSKQAGVSALVENSGRLLKISLRRKPNFGLGRIFSSGRRSWSYLNMTPDGVVYVLIGVNVAVFYLWSIADPRFMSDHFMISLDNIKSGRLHTIITSAFSHAEFDHLLSNMIGLYFFGTNTARLFGPEFLLKLYLAGALGGSVCFLLHDVLLTPSSKSTFGLVNSGASGLGASAAAYAIILLDVFLFPKNIYYINFFIPVPAMLMGALLIGTDLWRVKKGDSSISGSAHLGGALVAALVWARIKKGWI